MTYILRTQGTSRYFLFLFLCVELGTFLCTFNIITSQEFWEPQDMVLYYVPLTLFEIPTRKKFDIGTPQNSRLWYFRKFGRFKNSETSEIWHLKNPGTLNPALYSYVLRLLCTDHSIPKGSSFRLCTSIPRSSFCTGLHIPNGSLSSRMIIIFPRPLLGCETGLIHEA